MQLVWSAGTATMAFFWEPELSSTTGFSWLERPIR